jgi:hypothetical protein
VSAAKPFECAGPPAAALRGQIDKLVFGRLERLGIKPANLCSDAVFLRRAYLDVIGTLPTDQEVRNFLQNSAPDKRTGLIDRLLDCGFSDGPRWAATRDVPGSAPAGEGPYAEKFADYWAMKWSDLLRVKAEFPINLWPNAAQAYHGWIRESIKENKPYDKFVREMLTATGSNFQVAPVNFYRAVQNKDAAGLAQAVALAFMGSRTDKWPKERLDGMAAFFARVKYKWTDQWKEEIVYYDFSATTQPAVAYATGTSWPPSSKSAETQPACCGEKIYPDGTVAHISDDRDAREAFADWLIDAKNPWFARNITNRIWYWLMGRGIIQEPDDIRSDNPPSNPDLLAYLERELVASHYDLKHIYHLILTSKAYQLSCVPQANSPHGASGEAASLAQELSAENFAQHPLRRLDAEVLIDAICQITGTTEKYSSAIPEPWTYIPGDMRSVALPDGSITSSFLEEFGRPPRDSGLESERINRLTAPQRLHMLNSSHILNKIEQSYKLRALRGGPREIAASLYIAILSRYPTAEELKVAEEYWRSHASGRDALVDFAWALINSSEFLYRH